MPVALCVFSKMFSFFRFFANWHPHTLVHTHTRQWRKSLLVSLLLLLLLCLSGCQAAAAAGFSAFSAAVAPTDSFSSFINAGSVKIYNRKKGKSSQMENYGCTRAHTYVWFSHPLTWPLAQYQQQQILPTPPQPTIRSRLSFQVVLFNFEATEILAKKKEKNESSPGQDTGGDGCRKKNSLNI